ncbi:uncharacterized protein LOC131041425 isoform X2 [Cryptomeria japonica]|uniref:uncharacterized protein LOC131041425 isoform X2 n=1 Tax=Cryptomeria japonica TaxID=3369 RepID=UPI0027DA9D7F|nr:uncharacterized protein LOC131041425 isoform X2 [Cryptomeria japonica]XP_057830497.2 uncharacterized protein LOC131041425 isoform X2 [Cryptomeria japonica]
MLLHQLKKLERTWRIVLYQVGLQHVSIRFLVGIDLKCVESTYWWNGKVVVDTEVLLIIKTRDSLFNTLTKHVKALHPYKVPEIIAVPITEGSEDYMQWMKENTAVLNG